MEDYSPALVQSLPDMKNEEVWNHYETIQCPKCRSKQQAVVAHTHPYWSYCHICSCGYKITEIEWQFFPFKQDNEETHKETSTQAGNSTGQSPA